MDWLRWVWDGFWLIFEITWKIVGFIDYLDWDWPLNYIKIIGLSDHFDKDQLLHDKVGTSYYGMSDHKNK